MGRSMLFGIVLLGPAAAVGEQPKPKWQVVKPVGVEFTTKETATIAEDGVVVLSLPVPSWSQPTLVLRCEEPRTIRQVRLELRPDPRFADRRLGRRGGATQLFLFEVEARDGKGRRLEWASATGTPLLDENASSSLIDAATDTGWLVPPLPAGAVSHEIVFTLREPIPMAKGEEFRISVDSGGASTLDTLACIRGAIAE